MKEMCIDEGVLQSYLDGELSPEKMEWVAKHTVSCAACAESLREAESENVFFAAALADDLNVAVPTENLRTRLDAAIAELRQTENVVAQKPTWNFSAWLNSLFASFTPQRAFAFASIVAIIVFAAIFFVVMKDKRSATPSNEVARIPSSTTVSPTPVLNTTPQPSPSEATPPKSPASGTRMTPQRVNYRQQNRVRPKSSDADSKLPEIVQPEQVAKDLLPGEKSYLKAIQSLEVAIKESSDLNTSPALRAEYEKNLAVVNQAITATRAAVKRQPGNADTVEFLYTAYQSKVDLLSTVADQARLSALSRE